MPEIILILIIALVLFGPSKLPEMGSAVGKAIREFKGAVNPEEHVQKMEVEVKRQESTIPSADRKG